MNRIKFEAYPTFILSRDIVNIDGVRIGNRIYWTLTTRNYNLEFTITQTLFKVCVCVCLCMPPIVARQRLGINPLIVAKQRLGKNPPIVARQRLGINFTAVTNTQAIIEELLDASFSMWPVMYQGK
jgi:hypothetical protein